jgi:hypothetical protein
MQLLRATIKNTLTDRFKLTTLLLCLIGFLIYLYLDLYLDRAEPPPIVIHSFIRADCNSCPAQQAFLVRLGEDFPNLTLFQHDLDQPGEPEILEELVRARGYGGQITEELPVTIVGEEIFFGFDAEGKAEEEIVKVVADLNRQTAAPGSGLAAPVSTVVELPLIGEIDARRFSLPVLAVVLGLVDGLNPCAMWVLVYLITLILSLRDRRKIWLLVGTFVAASGILYFLFMTAWLNAFLLLGYISYLTLGVGFFALWVGVTDLYETFRHRGEEEACQVGDLESKQQTASRIKSVVMAPLTFGSFLAVVGLAFLVNSIEFLCSAAIPAVFTHILSLHELELVRYYLYILLYDFFFMLDDLVIFATAAFAATSSLGEKYARYTKPAGGVIMLALGVVLIFFPTLLR